MKWSTFIAYTEDSIRYYASTMAQNLTLHLVHGNLSQLETVLEYHGGEIENLFWKKKHIIFLFLQTINISYGNLKNYVENLLDLVEKC